MNQDTKEFYKEAVIALREKLREEKSRIEDLILYADGYRPYPPKADSSPTIESVYGKPLSELKPPSGWMFTGEFQEPGPGVYYLSTDGKLIKAGTYWGYGQVLILRKCKRLVFDIVDERKADPGELWMYPSNPGCVHRCSGEAIVGGLILSEPRVEE